MLLPPSCFTLGTVFFLSPKIRRVSVYKEFRLIWPKETLPVCRIFLQVVLNILESYLKLSLLQKWSFSGCAVSQSIPMQGPSVTVFFETTILSHSLVSWLLSLSPWYLSLPASASHSLHCAAFSAFPDDTSPSSSLYTHLLLCELTSLHSRGLCYGLIKRSVFSSES